MVQRRRSLYQIDSFEVYGRKVRGYKNYVNLSLQEVKEIIESLLSGLAQGRVEGFTVTPCEEEPEWNDCRGREKADQFIV